MLFTTLAIGGCASTDQPANGAASPVVGRDYRAGSNIPLRDPKPMTKEAREKLAEASRAVSEKSQKRGYTGRQLSRQGRTNGAVEAGSVTKPMRFNPAFCTTPISSATRP